MYFLPYEDKTGGHSKYSSIGVPSSRLSNFQKMLGCQSARWKLSKDSFSLRIGESDIESDIWFELQKKLRICMKGKGQSWRTGDSFMICEGGAMKTRTFSSRRRYLEEPPMTCFPGAPVRWPPGRNACRVPVKFWKSMKKKLIRRWH
jgi:hypothetical protein